MSEENEPWKDEEPEAHAFRMPLPAGLIAALKRDAERDEALHKLCQEQSDIAENTILLSLWKDLGDNTETYHEAFAAIALFQDVSHRIKVGPSKKGLTAKVAMRLFAAWAQVAQHSIDTFTLLQANQDTSENPED